MKINEKEAGDGSFFKKIATTKIVLLQQGHFFNIAQKSSKTLATFVSKFVAKTF